MEEYYKKKKKLTETSKKNHRLIKRRRKILNSFKSNKRISIINIHRILKILEIKNNFSIGSLRLLRFMDYNTRSE